MSAPYCRITSSGAVVLPRLFDIFSPSPSRVKPWVSTRLVGRAAHGAAGLQQRRVEPAAVLVGAFEIEARRPDPVGPVAQREGVGRAAVEPDVEDVGDLFPLRRVEVVAEEPRLRAVGVPGVGALGLEGLADPGVDRRRRAGSRRGPRRAASRSRSAARPRRAGATAPSRAGPRSSNGAGCARSAASIRPAGRWRSARGRGWCRRTGRCRPRAACRWRRTTAGCCGRSPAPWSARSGGRSASAARARPAPRPRPACR